MSRISGAADEFHQTARTTPGLNLIDAASRHDHCRLPHAIRCQGLARGPRLPAAMAVDLRGVASAPWWARLRAEKRARRRPQRHGLDAPGHHHRADGVEAAVGETL